MTQYIIKIFLTALLVVIVSEVSKRNTLLGGLLASLPLVSFLALGWLYWDTRDTGKVANLSVNIFWLVLPSLVFFLALPLLLKQKVSFALSMTVATLVMMGCYSAMFWLLKKLGLPA